MKSRSVLVWDPWSHALFLFVIRDVTLCSRLWSMTSRSVLVCALWSHALFSFVVREVTLCSRLWSVKSRSVLVCGPLNHALFWFVIREVTLCSGLWSVKSRSVLVCGPWNHALFSLWSVKSSVTTLPLQACRTSSHSGWYSTHWKGQVAVSLSFTTDRSSVQETPLTVQHPAKPVQRCCRCARRRGMPSPLLMSLQLLRVMSWSISPIASI